MSIIDVGEPLFMQPPTPPSPSLGQVMRLAAAVRELEAPPVLCFDDMVLGYAILTGTTVEVARTEMAELLRPVVEQVVRDIDELFIHGAGQRIPIGIISGLRSLPHQVFHQRPPRRDARRAHSRKAKRG